MQIKQIRKQKRGKKKERRGKIERNRKEKSIRFTDDGEEAQQAVGARRK